MPRETKFGDKHIAEARAKAVTEKVSNRVHVLRSRLSRPLPAHHSPEPKVSRGPPEVGPSDTVAPKK